MTGLEMLMSEHRTIEKGLDALDRFVARAEADSGADHRAKLAKFVEFLREYADRKHHGKEEDLLFVAMEKAGFPRNAGPIAVMLAEHEEGRSQVRILAVLAKGTGAFSDEERSSLSEAAGNFSALLRQHIQKEDNILYPMAQGRLGREAMAAFDEACRRFEENEVKTGEQARLQALAEEVYRG